MPDIIITPSIGKLEFVDDSIQVTRRHSFTLDHSDGLVLDAPLSAAAISAPLNVINVTVNNSNVNYPFVLAQSGETGAKNLLMDGTGGTYNPFTNTATIDISGNSATTTLASDSTNLGGVVAASYVTLTGTQTLTNKTITGTFTGNLTGTGSWATNAVSAVSATTATNSTQLNGQAASYYTNIPARLGYTPVNQAGDTIAGNLTVNGNFTVNGSVTAFSASNIYLSSSVITVEDNILTLNAFSPYLRYAGIEMYDSGSGTLSQLLWDGEGDYFFLTGSSVNGKIITGPDGQTNLTSNYIPKATAGYKLGNSLIYDSGTNIGIGITTPVYKTEIYSGVKTSAFTGLSISNFNNYDGTDNSLVKSQLRFAILENPISTYDASQRTFAILESGNEANNSSSDGFFAISTRLNGAVAEKFRITSTGNVGIGTTNPVSILDVVGLNGSFPATSSTTQSTGSLVRLRNGNSNLVLDIGGNGGNGNWLQSTNRSDLSANYPLLLNPNGGNVGIGMTGPAYKLDVGAAGGGVISVRLTPGYERVRYYGFDLLGYNDGNLWMMGNNPTNTLLLSNNWDWDYQVGFAYTPGTVGNAAGVLQIGQLTKNNANYTHGITRLYTNGLERITIIANGNIGIGTTSPSKLLHVHGTSGEILRLSMPSNYTAGAGPQLSFWHRGDEELASIRGVFNETGQGNRANLIFGTRTSDTLGVETKMTIFHNGNVGIGTTTPAAKLHINASGSSINLLRGVTYNDSNASFNNASLEYYDTSTSNTSTVTKINYNAYFNKRGTANITGYTVGNFNGHTQIDSGSVNLIWDYSSRIEIRNQATASSLVHFVADSGYVTAQGGVLGKATDRIGFFVRSQNQSALTLTNQYGIYIEDLGQSTNNYAFYSNVSAASNKYNIYAAGTANNYFAGYVGIGATSFVYGAANRGLLEIYGSTDALIALRNATANFYIQKSGNNFAMVNGGAGYMTFNTNGSDRLFIDSNGYIGIGTTSFVYGAANRGLLEVYGSTDALISLRNATTNSYIQKSGNDFYINNGGAGVISITTNSSERMRIASDGNVGIGTTVTAARLHVNSTTSGATLLRTDGTNGTLFSVVDDLSDSLMSVNNSAGLPVLEVFADDRIVAGQYGQNDFVIRNNYVGIGTNNPTSKLYVTSSTSVPSATFLGGNVGIGTSSPAAKLVVIGETQISSNAAYTTHFNYQDTGIHFISMANGGYTDFRGSSNNITTMRVKGDGSVGIGTTIPSAPLHVVGVISGSSFSGAGTGLTGTAANLTAGTVTTNANLTGDVTSTGNATTIATNAVTTTKINSNSVTFAKFQQVAALSVVGVSGNSTANVAAIAGSANQVLRVSNDGTALAFGQVNLAQSQAVTGTLAINNGGTGAATAQLAINALAGAVTNGQYLRGNGTNVVMSAIQAADVPTLNQNTTGNAATATSASTWTTARTLTVGLTGRSVNGSSDITWSLADIGALPLTGGTLSGQLQVNHSTPTSILRIYSGGSTAWSLGVNDAQGSYFNISADFGSVLINKITGNIWISGSGINNTVLHSGTTSAPNLSIGGTAATATNANAISFTEVELNAPATTSGTWTTGNGSEWGEPKFGSTFNQFRYADGDGPYVEYNVPANHHACFISQLQWDTGGYADCHGVQSDGDLVFLRRINTRQLVENSNHGNTIQHDGSTVTFVGSGLGSFTKIRITNRSGRIHMTGIAFTRQSRDGYEGTGMVHPAQISHQGAGSGLNADLLDGYSSATANTANTIVLRDASGNFSAGTITATLSGNVSGTAGGETFGTVTGRGSSTTTQISVGTTSGGSMYTGIKSGAGYSDSVSGATFKSITDHPTGGSYAFAAYFNGAPGTGTNSFFVAADGTGYFKGNVGIGTSNATAKLESYFSSNAITFNYLATNLNNNSPIPVYGFDVTNGAGENRSIKAGIGYERHLTNGRGTLHFYNDSTNDTQSLSGNRGLAGDIKMSIDNDGNVGIGSVTPSYKLHVMGNGYFSSTLQVNSNITLSGGGDVIINDSDGTGAFNSFMDSGIGYIRIDDGGSANGKLNINSGLLYVGASGGNVGIGSTSPACKLDVAGTIRSTTTEIFGFGASDNVSIRAASTSNVMGLYTSNSEKVRIDASGNVGVGTTAPGQKLDVEGRIRTRGATGTGGFEIGAASSGAAKWRIEWDSASDSLDFNWVG